VFFLVILDIFVILLKLLILFLNYVCSVSSCLFIILIIITMNASSYLFKLPPMMLSEYHQLGSCS